MIGVVVFVGVQAGLLCLLALGFALPIIDTMQEHREARTVRAAGATRESI